MNRVLQALSRRPFAIIGHRGAAGEAPENTLAALRRGFESGADILEVDVQKTADGVLVLLHDSNLKRVAGVDVDVRSLKFEELRRFKVGGEPIPTLREALEYTCGRVPLFVEVKNPVDTREVVDLIVELGCVEWVAVISFYDEALRVTRELHPEIVTGLIYSKPPGRIMDAKRLGASIVLPHYRLATAKAVAFAHRLGLRVVAWTVNDASVARELASRGVDGIATDYPSRLRVVRDGL